jgi:hypothetical protein
MSYLFCVVPAKNVPHWLSPPPLTTTSTSQGYHTLIVPHQCTIPSPPPLIVTTLYIMVFSCIPWLTMVHHGVPHTMVYCVVQHRGVHATQYGASWYNVWCTMVYCALPWYFYHMVYPKSHGARWGVTNMVQYHGVGWYNYQTNPTVQGCIFTTWCSTTVLDGIG